MLQELLFTLYQIWRQYVKRARYDNDPYAINEFSNQERLLPLMEIEGAEIVHVFS